MISINETEGEDDEYDDPIPRICQLEMLNAGLADL